MQRPRSNRVRRVSAPTRDTSYELPPPAPAFDMSDSICELCIAARSSLQVLAFPSPPELPSGEFQESATRCRIHARANAIVIFFETQRLPAKVRVVKYAHFRANKELELLCLLWRRISQYPPSYGSLTGLGLPTLLSRPRQETPKQKDCSHIVTSFAGESLADFLLRPDASLLTEAHTRAFLIQVLFLVDAVASLGITPKDLHVQNFCIYTLQRPASITYYEVYTTAGPGGRWFAYRFDIESQYLVSAVDLELVRCRLNFAFF